MSLWVIVANSSMAEIFEVKGQNIKKLQSIDFPEGRTKGGGVYSDRPGRSFDKQGPGRHALGTEVDLHMHQQQVFAHKLADILHKAKSDLAFEKLIIVAPPQFLGELRLHLSEPIKNCITKEINKDISNDIIGQERMDLLRQFLEMPRTSYAPPKR